MKKIKKITNEQKDLFLSSSEFKKIESAVIVKYKKCREFIGLKKMWHVRGEIKILDFFFDYLTYEQRMDIIGAETSHLGEYTFYDWWKGMTKTEKTEALLNLMRKNG